MRKDRQDQNCAVIEADFVIVGAGSAGCVLANRLTADSRYTVALIEAGVDDRPHRHLRDLAQVASNLNIHVPAGFTKMLKDPRVNWNYLTEPEPNVADRQIPIPRGKVLGGSSSINGMLWVRGLPEDYDSWRQLGLPGWGWTEAERYFRRIEKQEDGSGDKSALLPVSTVNIDNRMVDLMIEGFQEAGAPVIENINTTAEGIARARLNTYRGLRVSTAVAYLHPVMRRPNLTIITSAHVMRVRFDGVRAVGVEYHHDGELRVARARREVILSGGAINSPQLLELSGVGDAAHLRNLGIPVVAHSPRVGENLQDHYATLVRARLKPGTPGFNELSRGVGLAGQMIRFATARRGVLTTGGASLTAFLKSDPALDLPNLQFFASPATVDFGPLVEKGVMTMEREPGMTVGGYVMRPRSVGSIHIRSADYRDHPAIRPNFLDDFADQTAHVAMLRWARRIMHSPVLAPYYDHELTPGADMDSDEALLAFSRAAGSTAYHQACTCAMGPDGSAVLSSELKVNGVERLRVIDASSMPNIVSGNTNAGTVMIAEQGSDRILADALQA